MLIISLVLIGTKHQLAYLWVIMIIMLFMQPGSDMEKAEKLWAKKQKKLAARQARKRHLQQLRIRRQQRQAARRGSSAPQVCYSACCKLGLWY